MARHFITRLTTAQRTAGTAAVGELVFDTDLNQYFQGTASAGPNNWGMLAAESIASVVQYSPSTTYAVNEIVRDSMGLLYVSLVTSNTGNALSDTNSWLAVGGGAAGITVQDEGTALTTQADTINFTGAGVTATGTAGIKTVDIPGPQSLTGVAVRQLDALPKQAEYDYTVDPASTDVDLDSSEDFLNSLGFNLVFNNNRVIAANTTFYLYNTPPSPLTNATAEPDIILTYPNFGYNNMNLSNNRNSFIFIVEKGEGILSEFLIANDLPNVNLQQTITFDGVSYNGNTLFSTLYTRAASDTGTEVLTYNRADGSIDWRVSAAGTGDITAVNTAGNSGLQGGVTSGAANLSLTNTGVTAAAYANANVTVDVQGRITEISAGTLPNAPAINYNSGNPTLQSPVTAEQIRNLIGAGTPSGVQSGATFPTSPTVGMIFVLTTSIAGPPAFDEGVYIRTAQGQWQSADIVSINTIGPPGTATSQSLGKIVFAQQSDSFWISDGTEWHLMSVTLGNPDFTTGDEVAFDTRVADVRTRLVATVSNTYEDVRIEAPAMGDPTPTAGFSLAPETNSSNQVAFITIGLPNNTLATAFMNSLAVGDRIVTATEGRDNRTFGIIASASDLNMTNRTVRLTLECAATPNGFILAPFPPGIPFPDVTNVTAILGRANDIRPAERTLGALPDVSITADNTHFTAQTGGTTSVTNLMGDGDYIIATRVLELIFVSASDRAPYVEGTNVAFTASTVAQADIPTNILFTGAVTSSRTDGNLGEVVEITVDQRYATFFDQFNLAQGSTTERAISGATVGGWRAWNFVSDDVGVAVFNAHGDLFNQSISDFQARLTVGGGVTIASTLPSTTGTVGELISTTGATSVVGDQFERVTWSIPRTDVIAAFGTATSITVALYARLPNNDGSGGTVQNTSNSRTVTIAQGSVSDFVAGLPAQIMAQAGWEAVFTGANPLYTITADDDGTNVNLRVTSTVAGDLTPNAETRGSGVTGQDGFILVGNGTLASSGPLATDLTIDTVGAAPTIYPRDVYVRRSNVGNPTDWIPVDSTDRVTFRTGEDTGATDSHTYPGVTSTLGGQNNDPNVITYHFANENDVFAFFALTGAEANNGVTTREVMVTYGSEMITFPVGTQLGPAGGPDLDVLNRSVLVVTPGPLASQTTPTNFVIPATADTQVHVTGNNFELTGTGGIDVDLDQSTSTITIDGSSIGGGIPSGNDLPATTGTIGELFILTATDNPAQPGLYRRFLNSGTQGDWLLNGSPYVHHEQGTGSAIIRRIDGGTFLNGTLTLPAGTTGDTFTTAEELWWGGNAASITVPGAGQDAFQTATLTADSAATTGFFNTGMMLPAGTYVFGAHLTVEQDGLGGNADRMYPELQVTIGTETFNASGYLRIRAPHEPGTAAFTEAISFTGADRAVSIAWRVPRDAGTAGGFSIPIDHLNMFFRRVQTTDTFVANPGGTGLTALSSITLGTTSYSVGGAVASIDDIGDVDITGPANNQILQYSTGTNQWLNRTPTMVVNQTPLADHNNVVATAPTDNQVLTWDASTSMWGPETPTGGGGTTVGVWQAENGVAITVPTSNTPTALSWTTGAPFLFGTNFVTGGNSLPAGTYKFTLTSRCDQVTNAQNAGRGYWSTALTVGTTVYESGVDYIRYRQPHQGANSIITVYVTTTGAATTFSATSTLNVEAAGSSANSTIPVGGTRLIIERLS